MIKSRRFLTCYMRNYTRERYGQIKYWNRHNVILYYEKNKLYCEIPVYGAVFNNHLDSIDEIGKEGNLYVYDFSKFMNNISVLEKLPGLHSFHVIVDAEEFEKRIKDNEENLRHKKYSYVRKEYQHC